MSKLDFAKAKEDIAEIISIVKMVPETLQEKCFELLFAEAFKRSDEPSNTSKEEKTEREPGGKKEEVTTGKKLPSNVLVFMRRYNITEPELGKLFMLEHDPLLPVYKIPAGNMAKAQLSKCLMVLLENGLLNNAMTAPYAELRTSVKEDGFYDGNFNKVLKRNAKLFRSAISEDAIDEGGIVELAADGFEQLSELVRELGQQ